MPREAMEVELKGVAFFRVRRVLRRLIAGPGVGGSKFWPDVADGRGCYLRQGQRVGLTAEGAQRLIDWAQSG